MSVVVFVVSLKDAELVRHPGVYSQLVARMLASVLQQTDLRWRVVLVGRDLPVAPPAGDERFLHLPLDLPTPQSERTAMNWNKTEKLLAGVRQALRFSPSYCMLLDSDDCVRDDLVAFLLDSPLNPSGWYAREGYVYAEGSALIWRKRRDFPIACGSSAILRPDAAERLLGECFKTGQPYYSLSSPRLPCGGELTPLPFPAITYSVMNGENIFMSRCQASTLSHQENRWRYYCRKLRNYHPRLCSGAFRRRFGLTRLQY